MESKKTWNFKLEFDKAQDKGIKVVTFHEEHYPKKLRVIYNPPFALFYKGTLPKNKLVSVAIVGARRCSPYGELYAKEFAHCLASRGVQIISGMAKGVDGIGQRAALDVRGTSYAIVASGVDICYPREHIGLYGDLINNGGIISEYPIGVSPLTHHFPQRNRIISGLADVVLVIEAKERSGSLITADMALEQGKEVYALPGCINNQLSKGCNRLIKQGAGILLSPADLIEELGLVIGLQDKISTEKELGLDSLEILVYSCLDLQPKNIQHIFDEVRIPIKDLTSILIGLDMKGFVSEVSKNNYVKLL